MESVVGPDRIIGWMVKTIRENGRETAGMVVEHIPGRMVARWQGNGRRAILMERCTFHGPTEPPLMALVAWGKSMGEVRIWLVDKRTFWLSVQSVSRPSSFLHSTGVHTWADGRVYNGNFENGKEHGFGTLTFSDGVKYRGQFQQGVKQGYGIQLWKTRTYDGEWNKNKPHGQGRVVWSNGATYTGQFWEGKYHGLGVYVWPSGKKFVGRWEQGVKNGHGLYTWPSGKKYDGEYKGGLKHGYGRMQWADGQTYCGGWKLNKRSGRGIQTAPEGAIIHCGQWQDDEPVGNPVTGPSGKGPTFKITIRNDPTQEVETSSPMLCSGVGEKILLSSSEDAILERKGNDEVFPKDMGEYGDTVHSSANCRSTVSETIVQMLGSTRLVV
jgi:hypothetical protein